MNSTEPSTPPVLRSPLLMNRDNSALLVIDVQERLAPAIHGIDKVVWNIKRLIQGANLLGVPVKVTEQYPKGLGPTLDEIVKELATDANIPEKTMFSCRECAAELVSLEEQEIVNLVIVGIESHVCVLQSVLDFLAMGFNVYVVTDAISSRFPEDHATAVSRMELSGATTVTTEMALFEWCERAGSPEFKSISKIVREPFDLK